MGIVGSNYGLGWVIDDHRGNPEIGHDGSFINGYTATFSRFPEKNIAVIVLTNLNPTNVGWIGYDIAGFFLPALKGMDQLQTEQNADTSFNENIQTFLRSLATTNYDRSLVTETLIQRINPITKILFDSSVTANVIFVTSDKMTRRIVRYGVPVQKINYYRVTVGNETHSLAVYLTADNKIADLRGY